MDGATAAAAEDDEDETRGGVLRRNAGCGCAACSGAAGDDPLGGLPVPAALEGAVARTTRGGEPLDEGVRRRFEAAAGRDLGAVRIHRDAAAGATARALDAKAYTVGEHVTFAQGYYAPGTVAGDRLLAHELAHTAEPHGRLRKNGPVCEVPADASGLVCPQPPDTGVTDEEEPSTEPVSTEPGPMSEPGESNIVVEHPDYGTVVLSDDDSDTKLELRRLAREHGRWAMRDVVAELAVAIRRRGTRESRTAPGTRVPSSTPSEAESARRIRAGTVLETARRAMDELDEEFDDFLVGFRGDLRRLTNAVLDTNEEQARAQLARFGIDPEAVPVHVPVLFGPSLVVGYEARMQTGTPAATGMQAAAKVLLARREQLEEIDQRLRAAKLAAYSAALREHPYLVMASSELTETIVETAPEVQQVRSEKADAGHRYARLLGVLGAEYPPLAHFGRLDEDIDDLRTIASEAGGDRTAQLLADRITEQLENISKVRKGLEESDVNLWRLEKIVGLARREQGIEEASLEDRLIRDKVEDEEPGVLQAVALLVLDVAALLLAGPTGGLSLAVAAGVNAAVAVDSVQTYILEEAMANTAFSPAEAIAQEEPSLFWVAVDVVAIIPDLGDALRVFRSLSRGIKSLRGAETATEAAAAEASIRRIGREAGLADEVIERMLREGDDLSELGRLGVSSDEIAELRHARDMPERLVAEAGAANAGSSGPITATGRGLIFSCASPCTVLREKYAAQLGAHPGLERRLAQLEREAEAAAGDSAKLTEIARNAEALEAQVRMAPLQTWRTPLATDPSVDVDDLVRRRGSAAPTLDRKPRNWSAEEEALFRHGSPAEAEPGYRWVLRESGDLEYQRAPGFADDPTKPPRRFNPTTREFESLVPLVLESRPVLEALAVVGRGAKSRAEWLARLRAGLSTRVARFADLSDAALGRILSKSPHVHHIRGQIVEELGALDLQERAFTLGADHRFIRGDSVRDAAGLQLTDGMIVRPADAEPGVFEIVVIAEAKAGPASSRGLASSRVSLDRLSESARRELEREAIEAFRVQRGLDPDAVSLPAWATHGEVLANHPDEVEALMRAIHAADMGQVRKDFERLMPGAGERYVTITVDGSPMRVRASSSTTEVSAITPDDVDPGEALGGLEDPVVSRVEPRPAPIDGQALDEIARQLRAEQIVNGAGLE